MTAFPSYAFENDKVLAFHGKQVIASGTDFEKVAQAAEGHFEALQREKSQQAADEARKIATHITTPNGKQGQILGRTSGLWADEITVRFDNGQIRRYATFVGDGLKYSHDDRGYGPTGAPTIVESFQRALDETYTPSRDGLAGRLAMLDEVRRGATHLAGQGVSYADAQELDKIVLTAEAERNEVTEALEHLVTADAEAIAPPKMAYTAVEQADLGHSHSDSWLEVVAQEMIAESEAQDFDKLLNDGPTEFISYLDTPALDHAGTVRDLAIEHIHTKTAGFKGEQVEEYRSQFVASVELARKRELTYRQDVVRNEIQKEAKVTEELPDDALYL